MIPRIKRWATEPLYLPSSYSLCSLAHNLNLVLLHYGTTWQKRGIWSEQVKEDGELRDEGSACTVADANNSYLV